jgi:hypothetical protein
LSYRIAHRPDRDLLVVVFTGEVSFEEELRAVEETLARGLPRPGTRVLVDRRAASMHPTAADMERLIDVLAERDDALDHRRVAQLVASDLDYGMMRMLELKAEGRVAHDFAVFRSLPEAAVWLDVEAEILAELCRPPEAERAG